MVCCEPSASPFCFFLSGVGEYQKGGEFTRSFVRIHRLYIYYALSAYSFITRFISKFS